MRKRGNYSGFLYGKFLLSYQLKIQEVGFIFRHRTCEETPCVIVSNYKVSPGSMYLMVGQEGFQSAPESAWESVFQLHK
jgi:hypothetical protein